MLEGDRDFTRFCGIDRDEYAIICGGGYLFQSFLKFRIGSEFVSKLINYGYDPAVNGCLPVWSVRWIRFEVTDLGDGKGRSTSYDTKITE